MLSCISVAQYGTQLVDFFRFTEKVVKNKKIELVLLIVEPSFSPVSFAGLEELSLQMEKLRHHGVLIYLYAPSFNMSTLYLAASAEKVFIHPIGNICFGGFYKNFFSVRPLLEKTGIKFNILKTGKLKDTFAALGDSVPKNDFTKQLLQDYEDAFIRQVEKKWADKELYSKLLEGKIFSASEAKEKGFIEEIANLTEVFHKIIEKGLYLRKVKTSSKNKRVRIGKTIAVVFVNGEITDGVGSSLFDFTKKTIRSDKIMGIIKKLKNKKAIEAVLFRIDSVGGSSSAGYDMYQAIKNLSEKKLTVISIGNYATSAAYWMALGGNVIYADATSVIGAVGAITTRPYIFEALEKVGIQVTAEKLEETGVISFFEEYGEAATAGTEKWLSEIMSLFLSAVKEHRKIDDKTLEIISSGCSFSGSYAWTHGLIDQIGGIDQAMEYIRFKLGKSSLKFEYYPENKNSLLLRKLFRTGYR